MSKTPSNITGLIIALVCLAPVIGAAEVTYDSTSFIIDGRRTFIVSGSMHYFRVPRELWPELLLRAKRGGLNTITTYVAWNAHEQVEGEFDFEGDNDLDIFLSLAENMGLYTIVRPGPYICSERSLGGFPAWLLTKPGMVLRSDNRTFLKYVDRWFDRLIPIIARHQINRGGGMIMAQVENEFAIAGIDSVRGRRYMEHLRDGMIKRGITVPLITCKGCLPGCIECSNSFYPADEMERLKNEQPGMPLFATEFWSGWYDTWGAPHNHRDPSDLLNATWDLIAAGAAGYNYYMYFGGTNFGNSGHYLQTTSYDWDAPLSETVGLTDNYYATRLAARFAAGTAPLLTVAAADTAADIAAPEGLEVKVRRGPNGAAIFLENKAEAEVSGELSFDGALLGIVTVPGRTILPTVAGWEIAPGLAITAALTTIAGVYTGETRTVIIACGKPGGRGSIKMVQNGRLVDIYLRYPKPGEVGLTQTGLVDILVAGSETAARIWEIEGHGEPMLLIGPDYLGEALEHDRLLQARVGVNRPGRRIKLYKDGQLTSLPSIPLARQPSLPRLTDWEVAPEPSEPDESAWRDIDIPQSMIALGNGPAPYGWYQAIVAADEAREAQLLFTAASDRLTLSVNGRRIGVSPHPPENRSGHWSVSFTLPLNEGRNVITVLADNLGLIKGPWQLGRPMETEAKGVYGSVLLDGMEVDGWRFAGGLKGERERWYDPEFEAGADTLFRPYTLEARANSFENMRTHELETLRWFRTRFRLPRAVSQQGSPLKLAMDRMGKGSIWLNGHHIGRYWNIGPQFDYNLPLPWLERENVLVILEEEPSADPSAVRLKWDSEAYMNFGRISIDTE